jgi:hypothetical protein
MRVSPAGRTMTKCLNQNLQPNSSFGVLVRLFEGEARAYPDDLLNQVRILAIRLPMSGHRTVNACDFSRHY